MPIVCVARFEPQELELVDDGKSVWYPHQIGRCILICGSKASMFPFQLFVSSLEELRPSIFYLQVQRCLSYLATVGGAWLAMYAGHVLADHCAKRTFYKQYCFLLGSRGSLWRRFVIIHSLDMFFSHGMFWSWNRVSSNRVRDHSRRESSSRFKRECDSIKLSSHTNHMQLLQGATSKHGITLLRLWFMRG